MLEKKRDIRKRKKNLSKELTEKKGDYTLNPFEQWANV